MKQQRSSLSVPIFLSASFFVLVGFAWYASDPVRAARLDRYFLYNMDDVLNFGIIRGCLSEPAAFFGARCKLIFLIVSRVFLGTVPLGVISLRFMNALFCTFNLFLLYRILRFLEAKTYLCIISLLFTLTSSFYFLDSISVLSEPIFTTFLLSAIYSFYRGKTALCAGLVACLPLIRLEGCILVALYALYFLRNKDYFKAVILFVPFFLWSIINLLVIGYPFILFIMPHSMPPDGSLISVTDYLSYSFLLYQPLTVFAVIGLLAKLGDKRYFPLFVCLTAFFSFIVFQFILALKMTSGRFLTYDLKFLAPVIPILSIFAIDPIQRSGDLFKHNKAFAAAALITAFMALPFSLFYSVKKLQQVIAVKEKGITLSQEASLRDAAMWLSRYLDNNKFSEIYTIGNWVVDKPVRHIWFWLPGNIAFYALVDGGPPGTTEFLGTKLLSMVSYKFARNHPVRGVFISLLKDDDPRMPENLRGLNYELVREYPSIPLYFYRLE